jgi:DNA replication protein DnaC
MTGEISAVQIAYLVKWGFPKTLIGKPFVTEKPERLARALANVDKYFEKFDSSTAFGLLVAGGNGTGKTMVITHLATRLFIEKRLFVRRVVCDDVVRFSNSEMFGKASERPTDYADLRAPQLLVIDNVPDTVNKTRNPMPLILKLVKDRFEKGKPTIVICPYTTEEVASVLGSAFVDFSKESMLRISLDGLPDFREGIQAELRAAFGN